MISPETILNHRVDLLEDTYIGATDKSDAKCYDTILERVDRLAVTVQRIENDIPSFRAFYEMTCKLRPVINEKKVIIAQAASRIDSLIANKQSIQKSLSTVLVIKDLSQNLDSEFYKDVESWQLSVEKLDQVLQPLIKESKAQSQEIDELLTLYEQAMTVMSDVCCSWEAKLRASDNSSC